MEVSTMFYICRYCVFTLADRKSSMTFRFAHNTLIESQFISNEEKMFKQKMNLLLLPNAIDILHCILTAFHHTSYISSFPLWEYTPTLL